MGSALTVTCSGGVAVDFKCTLRPLSWQVMMISSVSYKTLGEVARAGAGDVGRLRGVARGSAGDVGRLRGVARGRTGDVVGSSDLKYTLRTLFSQTTISWSRSAGTVAEVGRGCPVDLAGRSRGVARGSPVDLLGRSRGVARGSTANAVERLPGVAR